MQIEAAHHAQRQAEADREAYAGAPDFAAPRAPNMAPTPENAAQLKKPSPFDSAASMVDYLRSKKVSPQYIKPYLDQMEKFRPKAKADQQIVTMPDGSLGLLNLMDDGSHQVVPYTPAEKQKEVNLGDRVGMVGEYSGKQGSSFGMGIGPDSIMRDVTTRRGQDMQDSRSRDLNAITQQGNQRQIIETPSGPRLVDKRTGQAMPVMDSGGKQVPGDAQMKREQGAKQVLDLLKDAERHLATATNSYVGAGYDIGHQVVGHATEGAKSIAALKTIEGALLSQMPRMEGPQSNYDVQMYKQAAGQLGDPTIPREIKQQAILQIKAIQQRYAGGQSAPSGGGFKYLGKE